MKQIPFNGNTRRAGDFKIDNRGGVTYMVRCGELTSDVCQLRFVPIKFSANILYNNDLYIY